MPLVSTESFSRLQRSYEVAAFARYEAYQEEQDAFMEALEKCKTLEDAFNVFGDEVVRQATYSDIFDRYLIDGYEVLVCEDCGRLVDPGESQNQNLIDQCPHCGFTYEHEDD